MPPRLRSSGVLELLALGLLAIAVPLGIWIVRTAAGQPEAFNDFHPYWLAGRLVAEGRSPYDLDALNALARAEGLSYLVGTGYSYPPPFALLMVPLSGLPFTAAALTFNGLSLAVFGATVAGWIRWAHGFSPELKRRRAILALAAGAYPPVYGSIANGQANLLVLGILALGTAVVLDSKTGARRAIGGVAIGLAAVVKLLPGVLILPLLLGRRLAASGGLVLGALGSWLLAVFLAPATSQGTGRLSALLDPDAYFTNQSLNGFVTRLVVPSDRTVALFPGLFDPRPVVFSVTIGLAVATGIVLWRRRAALLERRGLALGLGLALTAGLIGGPKNGYWTEALALVAVGLLLLVDGRDLRLDLFGRLDRALLAGWLLGALVQAVLWLGPPPTTSALAGPVSLLTSASLYGLLALWWLFTRRLGRSERPKE
jgi:alpha-1,2-mannosyltransferase